MQSTAPHVPPAPRSPSRTRRVLRARSMRALGVLAAGAIGAIGADAQCELETFAALDAAFGDNFGVSVSCSGDTALVGSHQDDDMGKDSGSAYVFERQGPLWVQTAKLTASDGAAFDYLGFSVALSGDTAVVGAGSDDDGGSDSGSAYVFERQGAVWIQVAKLTASDAEASDGFGASVSISGDTVLVGAIGDDDGGTDSGAAYLFVKPAGAWTNMTQTAKLTASDAFAGAWFGRAVSFAGGHALVGAPYEAHAGAKTGAAYLFDEPASGGWVDMTETQKLTASGAAAGDRFGWSLSLAGNTAVVGAFQDDIPFGVDAGSAYVFERLGTLWVQTARLTASDGAPSDWFGLSVALSGDAAVIGAVYDDDAGKDSGSAYVFNEPAGGWKDMTETSKRTPPAASAGVWFGYSASLSGDAALIGARYDGNPAYSGSASAFPIQAPAPASEVVRLGAPPNPAAFLPGVTKGPIVGATWDPVIDHATFLPGAQVDFIGIGQAQANLPSPFGTVLCGPAPGIVVTGLAGVPFAVKVPPDCVNIGLKLTAQGGALAAGPVVALANALDLTLGTY